MRERIGYRVKHADGYYVNTGGTCCNDKESAEIHRMNESVILGPDETRVWVYVSRKVGKPIAASLLDLGVERVCEWLESPEGLENCEEAYDASKYSFNNVAQFLSTSIREALLKDK